jgi:hypothetical protein
MEGFDNTRTKKGEYFRCFAQQGVQAVGILFARSRFYHIAKEGFDYSAVD